MYLLSALTAQQFFSWVGYILVALICLMFMIVVHEFGHYITGKLFKFTILEYSIGFGPKLFQRVTNKETGELFSIRCIPLGGYCQFAGEDEEVKSEGDFNAKPVWQRIIVLFAGAFMNLLSAVLIISIFFMSYGDFLPKVEKTYDYVDSQYVQQLKEGDLIYKIDGKNCYSLLSTQKTSSNLKGKESAIITVIRDGKELELKIDLHEYKYQVENEEGVIEEQVSKNKGLGISMSFEKVNLSFFKAIGHAFEFIFDVIILIFTSIGSVFTGAAKASETLGGTVTAISALAQLSQQGFAAIMYGVCVLSASIGVMNLLPIPALDGCRIVFCIIEGIIKKPINKKVEGIIHAAGLILLFGLAILLDLMHFIG